MPSSSAPGVSSSERKEMEAAQKKKEDQKRKDEAKKDEARKKESRIKEQQRKEYMAKAAPDTVEELVDVGDLESKWFKEGEWAPQWAPVEFDGDACVANVSKKGKEKEGFFVPAGSILPLGASLPEMTVLKYGGWGWPVACQSTGAILIWETTYFPAGTSFQGGVLIPLHARMVNILPEEAKEAPTMVDEGLCAVQ